MRKIAMIRFLSFSLAALFLLPVINSFARNAPVTTAAMKLACPSSSVDVPITVNGFTSVCAITLRIEYDPTKATFFGAVGNSALANMSITSMPISANLAKIMVVWSDVTPVTLPANAALLTLTMNFIGGSTDLTFNNTSGGGQECEYADEAGNAMTDTPTASYYINGSISSLAVGATGSITGSSTVCAGATGVAYSIAAVTNATSYSWALPSGFNMATGSNTNAITVNVSGSAISGNISVTPSNACGSGTPSPNYAVTVNPALPVSVVIAASANPVCAGTSVTFTATPANGGTTPAYQWKVNGVNTGSNSATYSYVPSNNDVVACVLTSNATCPTGNPATSNSITMAVSANLPVSLSIAASANPVCAGTSVTFTATPANGGTTPAYQWKVNGNNAGSNTATYSYVPVNNDVVTCVLTSNAVCVTGNPAISNALTMTVNPLLPVSLSIAASANPVCAGTSVTFTATPANGGTSPAYQWKVNGTNAGSNISTYSYVPVNNDAVICVLTSNATCPTGNPATSNTINMTVNPELPVSVAIVASANPVCPGTSVTFTATPSNGGTTPAYQWKVNGNNAGSNSAIYVFVPVNNDVVSCVLTSNASPCATGSPATSNSITMGVNANSPVSVTIAASSNPVCAGTSVTFTATPINGGTSPSYQWKINGNNAGSNTATYTYVPVNNDAVTCVLTSNAVCVTGNPATSNSLTITVNPLLTVSLSIAASANPVCAGTSVTFTATPANGGTAPVYQWKVNGNNTGTSNTTFTYAPANNDIVTCELTSNATCPSGNPATSNALTMTVNPILPVSIWIAASANPVCPGTPVTLTATATNGGTTPVYQWKVNGNNVGTNNPVYSYIPSDNDVVICVLTSNAAPCATGNPATSNAIMMTINSAIPVSVSIAASANPACEGNMVTFTATPTNGGPTPLYQWKVNGNNAGSNSATFSYVPLSGDEVYVVLTSSLECATGNPATSNQVTMTINQIPDTPVVTSNGDTLSSSASSGNQWYFQGNPISGATGQTHVATLTGWYWSIVTVNGCPSDTSNHEYVIITGIEEIAATSVRVFPVPNNGKFTVSINTPVPQRFTLLIYNWLGQKIGSPVEMNVNTNYELEIDLRPVPGGIYMLEIKNSEQCIVRKILVNR